MSTCKRCSADLSVVAAHKWRTIYCVTCGNALVNEACRRYAARDPERQRRIWQRYDAAHREERRQANAAQRMGHRDQRLEYQRAYNRTNAERKAAYKKRRRLEDPDGVRSKDAIQKRQWTAANPGLVWNAKARARCKAEGLECALTHEEWLLILESFGHRCAYCIATGIALEQDHVVPTCDGGRHDWTNVVPACVGCNSRKRRRPVWVMLQPEPA
jgi:5-methylcytosine-specific restriction endonuclease McrA